MTLHDLTSKFSNNTTIQISTEKDILYIGRIFEYSSKIDKKYLGYNVTWCEIEDNILYVWIEE